MKKENNFLIEKNNCSNLDELIDLTKTYYKDGDIINKDYLKWQYLQNPTGEPFLFVSREVKTNELAGQYLVLPTKFNVLNNTEKGSLSLNTLTSPKFQGRGLFTKMAEATFNDCANQDANFTIGFPNPQSYPGFVKRLNFQHLGDIPLLIKPIKFGKIFFSFLKKEKKKHGGDISIDQTVMKSSNIALIEFKDNETRNKYNEFWDLVCSQYTISTFKDFDYLKWRYDKLPTRKYFAFAFEDDNIIKGVIILRAEHVWGFNVGLIMDLIVLDNNFSVGKQLLKYAKKLYKKNNIDFIATLHNKTNEYSILKKTGYLTLPQKFLPQKIHFIVRLNKEFKNSNLLFKLQNWKLSFSDYDVF